MEESPQPLWQPPALLVALLAWLRSRGRDLMRRARGNPRVSAASSAGSLLCGLMLRRMYQARTAMGTVSNVPLSTLLRDIEDGRVARAVVSATSCAYWLRSSAGKGAATTTAAATATSTAAAATAAAAAGATTVAAAPGMLRAAMLPMDQQLLVKLLHANRVAFSAQGPAGWRPLLVLAVPFVYLGACGYLLWRMSADLGFESRELPSASDDLEVPAVTFADVAGLPQIKEQVMEVVTCLREPERYARVGARCPRGVLLAGPPGTGKTLLAKAIASAANMPFLACSGSDFVEVFVGRGAKRVRTLFEEAARRAPCVLFIDELDAVGGRRGAGGAAGGLEEHEHTLNQLLAQMDGVGTVSSVLVVGATNRLSSLDPALLRPGRFDRVLQLQLPDAEARLAILQVHARRTAIADAARVLPAMAAASDGFSGAELANLVNEAAISAVRANRDQLTMDDFASSLQQYRASRAPQRGGDAAADGGGGADGSAGNVLAAWLQQAVRAAEGLEVARVGGAGAGSLEDND